jgi:NodT family efflux transporter outer membrane factor (OMF) lipoprotein
MNARARGSVVALTTGLLLAGCASGPDFHRPEPPATQAYRTEPLPQNLGGEGEPAQHLVAGADPGAQWWTRFESPALDQLVERALAANQTVAAAAAALDEAQELVTARSGASLPQLELDAGIGRQKYGAQFLGPLPKPPPFTYFSVGPAVHYTFDFAGGISRGVEQQRALAEYRGQQLAGAQLAISGNAVLQALQIAALRAQLDTVKELLERDRRNLALVQQAHDAGSVSQLDVISAQSQLASDTTQLPPLRESLGVAEHALAVILGAAPGDAALPELDLAHIVLPGELPISVPSELARRRPDILAAEAQLHAATAAVGIAQSNLYPHVTLTAAIGQQALRLEDLFDPASTAWGLTAGLVAPLFDGGTLRAQHRASLAALQASAANYRQTVLEALEQVANALQALDQGAEQLQAQANAQRAARETVDLTHLAYDAGEASILQVLDAERRYQQARLGYVRAQARRYLDSAQLFLALGAGVGAPAPVPVPTAATLRNPSQ